MSYGIHSVVTSATRENEGKNLANQLQVQTEVCWTCNPLDQDGGLRERHIWSHLFHFAHCILHTVNLPFNQG